MTTVEPIPLIEEAHKIALAQANGAIVASYYLPTGGQLSFAGGRGSAQGWQRDAWFLWKCLGEIQAPTTYIARVVSRRISWIVDGMSLEASDELLQRAVGDTDFEELVRLIVLNLEVAGELFVVEDEPREGEDRRWCVYSVVQPKLSDIETRAKADGRYYRRIYVSDPTDTDRATASTSGILDSAYDLLTLSRLSRAQNQSRIAQAGILAVPQDQNFSEGDPFGADFEEACTTAIQDIDSASAVVPIVVKMNPDAIEKIRHITLTRDYDDSIPEKMDRATRRIAMGLDTPVELLLGTSDQNHWNAWVTQEETYRGTIAPLAEIVADVLQRIVQVALNQLVTIEPDPSELLARRLTPMDAINAWKAGLISPEIARVAMGFKPDDNPSEADLQMLFLLLGSGRQSSGAEPSTSVSTSPPNQGVEP